MFLCWTELVGVRMEWVRSLSTVVVLLYLYCPWSSSQTEAGRDPTMAKFEGRQLVHAILTKLVFARKSLWS